MTTYTTAQWLEAAFLGLLHGLTEFLPVSSSAHLRIAGALLPSGTDSGAAFTAITQIGIEAAVLLYFRRDIWRITLVWLTAVVKHPATLSPDARLGWLIILGTLPIAILGALLKHQIEGNLRKLYITATALIGFGLILGVADRIGARRLTLERLGWGHGLLLGFAQALALVPGVSRSGGTISAALLLGYTREAAARYSFLLAIPAAFRSMRAEVCAIFGSAETVIS
ncbi:undecaprenyl-diphosphate phosphatase [Sphingomonas sp. 2SG]|uniref:undecaprenyl-diphosphate phosphatase n=1 Tax=Sphingomonas sp. 2SG TaxID=2502201 RepID=UPI0010F81AD0|nr:undecaprenyl-diphosphate phosphatase [Sphingomonas sp. 2SG]